ncbi:uncharacterized protein BYT42DRAFT_574600 [Radiomyces spectabilis]|uniref:uncharacterized protein n=1 Tax=Radiomyces spectabilis TaxID=64574 RepID=UPI002220F9D6|nr:uncharacterized protein BYT42DRAFT_574600 [Radiomyces spectabilis]KAI8376436.1 hypothetical protein BYT42DRAFT_574600 [Radiomyces spectabilis]
MIATLTSNVALLYSYFIRIMLMTESKNGMTKPGILYTANAMCGDDVEVLVIWRLNRVTTFFIISFLTSIFI